MVAPRAAQGCDGGTAAQQRRLLDQGDERPVGSQVVELDRAGPQAVEGAPLAGGSTSSTVQVAWVAGSSIMSPTTSSSTRRGFHVSAPHSGSYAIGL
jgi:hypothetical protein